MRTLRYREALREAMTEEMERDDRIFLMGEEVGHYQGAYKVSEGLLEKFGDRRVIDTPIAEGGFAGIGIGAAMVGLRPIIEFMTWNFSAVAFDQILNNAAKLRQMSGGQFTCPIVFRGPNGSAKHVGSQHSHSMEHFYATIPGVKVVAPAFPADAKGLLKAAVRDENPVLVMDSETLYGVKGEVPDGDHVVEIGKAHVAQEGTDITFVAYSRMTYVALEAAAALAKENVSVEVVDLRSLRPLDEETVVHQAFYWNFPYLTPIKGVIRYLINHFLHEDRVYAIKQREGLEAQVPFMLIGDADAQIRWFQSLRQAWLYAEAEGIPFENPITAQTLRFRS